MLTEDPSDSLASLEALIRRSRALRAASRAVREKAAMVVSEFYEARHQVPNPRRQSLLNDEEDSNGSARDVSDFFRSSIRRSFNRML